MKFKAIAAVTLLLSTIVLANTACQSAGGGSSAAAYMSFAGSELQRPEGYREWVFVGEPVTPNDMNGGKAPFPEFHSVYIDPRSFEHYERTGEFPDGTILVKELVSVGSKEAVSGNGYFMGDFIGLEATVKSAERFPDEPGNWAYFSFSNPGGALKSSAEAFPTASCNACHQGNAGDDFVFTQHYPVLSEAKGRGGSSARKGAPFKIGRDGQLQRPEGYRHWVFVGAPVTPNDMNGGKAPFPDFHSVYIDPESFKHYERTGEFRDGTILVKELVSVGSKQAVSGKGYFMGDFIGLEATVKSAKHFPNEPGNWAYFSFSNPGGALKDATEAFPTASCNACHQGNAGEDFVFTQYYPVLSAAAGDKVAASSGSAMVPADEWQATAATPSGSRGGVPLDGDALFKFLKAGKYLDFPAKESGTHPGRGPHTAVTAPVRVFYNDALSSSLKAGNAEHPNGAAAVKEMFSKGGDLAGWAVMVKTQASSDEGRGWLWYEVTSSTDSTAIAAIGNGVPGCVSCHSFRDQDLILSGYPLR
ncbi:MAG: hypothetical protein ACJAZN_003065 [Planctomycetota bacterium]|jgi:hypothetical protein